MLTLRQPNKSKHPALSTTTMDNHSLCPRRSYFGDRSWGLGYSPVFQPVPLLRGLIIHGALARYYNRELVSLPADGLIGVALDELRDGWRENGYTPTPVEEIVLEDTLAMSKQMIVGFISWIPRYQGGLADRELTYVSTESEFGINVGDFYFKGRVDGLAIQKQTEEVWLVEHKTTSNPDQLQQGIEFDWQPRLYAWAIQNLTGLEIAGVIYNLVTSTDPYDIKILKSGLPSKAKDVLSGTTQVAYRTVLSQAIMDEGLDPASVLDDYAEVLDRLAEQDRGDKALFRRVAIRVTQEQMQEVPWFIEAKGRAMLNSMEWPEPYLSRHTCVGLWGGCPFRYPCQLMSGGGDYETYLERTFGGPKQRHTTNMEVDMGEEEDEKS